MCKWKEGVGATSLHLFVVFVCIFIKLHESLKVIFMVQLRVVEFRY